MSGQKIATRSAYSRHMSREDDVIAFMSLDNLKEISIKLHVIMTVVVKHVIKHTFQVKARPDSIAHKAVAVS